MAGVVRHAAAELPRGNDPRVRGRRTPRDGALPARSPRHVVHDPARPARRELREAQRRTPGRLPARPLAVRRGHAGRAPLRPRVPDDSGQPVEVVLKTVLAALLLATQMATVAGDGFLHRLLVQP